MIFGGIAYIAASHWDRIKSVVTDYLADTVNFKVLPPTRFDALSAPGVLKFNFNYQLTNPSSIPLRIENLTVGLFHYVGDQQGGWVKILQNSLADQTRTIIMQPGRQEHSHQISVPVTGSLSHFKDILINRFFGDPQTFKIVATAKILGEQPMTHEQTFTL